METYEVPPAPEITSPYIDDLVRALEEAKVQDEEWGVTVKEISRLTNWNIYKVRKKLGELNDQGRLESRYVRRPSISGRMAGVPVYRLK